MVSLDQLLAIATALVLLVLAGFPVVQGAYYYQNTNYRLALPNDNVYLTFDETRTFDDFIPDAGTDTLYFDLPDTYTVSSLTFSGSECNVTVTEIGENNKLVVADVDVVSSSSNVNFTLGYSLPYLQYVEGDVTNVDVCKFDSNRLCYSVTGVGVATMKVHFPTGQTPYYLKINDAVSTSWSASGNTVTVTDNLGSTHDYELGFSVLPSPPSEGGTPPGDSDDDDGDIPLVSDVFGAGSSFLADLGDWLWVFIFLAFVVLVCVAFLVHRRNND